MFNILSVIFKLWAVAAFLKLNISEYCRKTFFFVASVAFFGISKNGHVDFGKNAMIHLWGENKCGKLLLERKVLQLRDVFLPKCIKVQVF